MLEPAAGAGVVHRAGQRESLAATAAAIGAGAGIGWWLFALDAPDVALGQIHLSQITHRAFCNAVLGYSIDAAIEGRGLMHEALQAALADAFGPRVQLRRVQAHSCGPRTGAAQSGLADRPGPSRRNYLIVTQRSSSTSLGQCTASTPGRMTQLCWRR